MDNEGLSFSKRVTYVKQLLSTIKPKIPKSSEDLVETKCENERQISTLREYILPMITDLEQSRMANTYRIIGMPENPRASTLTNVINYFKFYLNVESKLEDYCGCYIREGGIRKVIVHIKNDRVRNKIWSKKSKAKSRGILICEELCDERARVRQKAIQNFGREKVLVNKGVIYVKMPDDTLRDLRTDIQCDKLIQERIIHNNTY